MPSSLFDFRFSPGNIILTGTNCFSNVIKQILLHLHPYLITALQKINENDNKFNNEFKNYFQTLYSYFFLPSRIRSTENLRYIVSTAYIGDTLDRSLYATGQQVDCFLFFIDIQSALFITYYPYNVKFDLKYKFRLPKFIPYIYFEITYFLIF